jgi:acyl carrier protein/NAD(P)-dependent dehydrogenase (short-subunit alcohol dehydrogenase family)
MAEIKSGPVPTPAVVLTGFDSAAGQSSAAALARAGARLCVIGAPGSDAEARVAKLPSHDRLHHEAIVTDLGDAAAVQAAARQAKERLGQVTALLHVVLPDVVSPGAKGGASNAFDPESFGSELRLGAGAFLGLALGLLPDMLATQTGCVCALTSTPDASFANAPLGSTAALGALLGAVRQLADRCAGTPLRSIVLSSAAARGSALGEPALAALVRELAVSPGVQQLANGWFAAIGGTPQQGKLEFLRAPPPAPAASAPVQAVSVAASAGADRVGEKLAQTFRATFGLPPDADVSGAAVGKVARWDSLGHLKLMMEVEQALRVRLPADALARIQSYRDLEKAVRAYLPAQ